MAWHFTKEPAKTGERNKKNISLPSVACPDTDDVLITTVWIVDLLQNDQHYLHEEVEIFEICMGAEANSCLSWVVVATSSDCLSLFCEKVTYTEQIIFLYNIFITSF